MDFTEEKREDIRRRIKSDAINLCTKVVNTTIEYKEEIVQLEKDNTELKKRVNKLKFAKTKLQEENKFIRKELKEKDKKINKLIDRLGEYKICSICFHSLSCESSLCVYCQKWVCNCCFNICKNIEDDVNYLERRCGVVICCECFKKERTCPTHSGKDNPELIAYYKKNRFKHYEI